MVLADSLQDVVLSFSDRGHILPVITTLLLLILTITSLPAYGVDPEPRKTLPVHLDGDWVVDQYFDGAGTDGLSPGTAHVLEHLDIQTGGDEYNILIRNSSRHIVVQSSMASQTGIGDRGDLIRIEWSSNVTVRECDLRNGDRAINVIESNNVSIINNRIKSLGRSGIKIESSQDVNVEGNSIEYAHKCIRILGSEVVILSSNYVCMGDVGVEITETNQLTISSNRILNQLQDGIQLRNTDDGIVTGNVIEQNIWSGIVLSYSDGNTIEGNTLYENMRGILVSLSSSNNIRSNNITNNIIGVRLASGYDNRIIGNTIDRNRQTGLDLVDTHGNEILDNQVTRNERGILFTRSVMNNLTGNTIVGNLWIGIGGDTEGNYLDGNELRANEWLKDLRNLIVTVSILVAGVTIYRWWKRRSKEKVEKGKVLIRKRFQPGGKGLWAISRVLWDEDFFRSQLNSAGPQREQILERYENNIAAAKQLQYILIGIMTIMLAAVSALPLSSLMNLSLVEVTSANVNDIAFASSISIGLYFVMSFVILLVFGLLFMASLLKGDNFRLLGTLPLDRRSNRRLIGFLLMRMYGIPFGVVLFFYPIGGLIITHSIPFFISAVLINLVYLLFIAYLMIVIADVLSKKVFSANATKSATVMRILVMSGYLVAMMFAFVTIEYMLSIVRDLYVADRLSGGSGEVINMAMSLVPFPFSGAYLLSVSMVDLDVTPLPLLASSIGGVALLVGSIFGLRNVANRALGRVALGSEVFSEGPGQVTTAADINLKISRPIPAFARQSLVVTSRDMGSIIYLIMPILFPFIMIISTRGDLDIGFYDPLLPLVLYMGVTPFLVNMALSTSDANLSGVISSLPFRMMDQFRAKQINVISFMLVPPLVITLLMFNQVSDPTKLVAIMSSMMLLSVAMSSIYLVTFSWVFGHVNNKYTFFMARINAKVLKYLSINAIQYFLVIGEIIAFYILVDGGILTFWQGIAALVMANLALIVVGEVGARLLFK
jgi:parallel beta-helix repeat protein